MSETVPDTESTQLPEELPPVQPPSAGFIVQLFVVPGLIVAAIVAVYLLFGRLAGADADWRSQLVELRHPNQHRRWRGALGLSQMLSADQNLGDRGQHLASNREMAQALADVLSEELRHGGQAEIDREYAAFLARALGLFNIPEIVVPPLEEAMQPGHDREVRKNAIASIAVMTDRLASANQTWDASHAAESLRLTSMDADPVFRQLCAFALGQFNDAASQARLEVMLEDGDADTRVNAAIGLARQGDPRGAVVIGRVLQQAGDRSPVEGDDWERFLSLKNCLTAVERLAPTWTKSQRDELSAQLAPIAADHQEPKIRILAKSALAALAAQ